MGAFGSKLLGGVDNALRIIVSTVVIFLSSAFTFPREISSTTPWIYWPDQYCVYVAADELPVDSRAESCGDFYGPHPSVHRGEKSHFIGVAVIQVFAIGPTDLSALSLPAAPRFVLGKYANHVGLVVSILAGIVALVSMILAKGVAGRE